MLRSIPDKFKGVLIMFFAIVVLFFLPLIPFKRQAGSHCILSKTGFSFFVSNFVFLGWLASHPMVYPYSVLCGVSTFLYFFYILVFLPFICFLEA